MGLRPTQKYENRRGLPLYSSADVERSRPMRLWVSRDRRGVWPGTCVLNPSLCRCPTRLAGRVVARERA
jgi:hypothetical protein